jgi:hypothetical protein
MLRTILIAAGAAALLMAGVITAVATTGFAKPVSDLATGTTLKAEAKGDAVSKLTSRERQSTATEPAETAIERADADIDENDNETHGDVVSAVAKSDATAAHENGAKKVNHGGAVSAAAHKD